MLVENKLIDKTETIRYFVDSVTKEILDENKKYVYCHFHFDQRIYLNKSGFFVCNKCNEVFFSGANKENA